MTFSELKHQANEAQYHLTMYTRFMGLHKEAKQELKKIPLHWIHTAWVKNQEAKKNKHVAMAHLDQYNSIMIHLNELYPAKKSLESLGI